MEPNRAWHDPVVEIYGNAITPGIRCSAEGYDLANRRWYRLDVDAETEDDEWLSSVITKHLREYHAANGTAPPWNTIITSIHGGEATYASRAPERVERQIRQSLDYGPTNKLPVTDVDNLETLTYISRAADRCSWHGQDCVFKRIEFDVDIEAIEDEIRVRETLLNALTDVPAPQVNAEMVQRFCLVPILAVVISTRKPWKIGTVAGILTPHAGPDLEMLAQPSSPGLQLDLTQLRDLVAGISELHKLGVQHGDITYWNTTLQPSCQDGRAPKLMLIDAGTEAPEYTGDAQATGTLLLWCLDNCASLREDPATETKVRDAASALMREDFPSALNSLDAKT